MLFINVTKLKKFVLVNITMNLWFKDITGDATTAKVTTTMHRKKATPALQIPANVLSWVFNRGTITKW